MSKQIQSLIEKARQSMPPFFTITQLETLTCPPKPGPGIMLEFLTKEDRIWPEKDEHRNRL